MTRVYGTGVYDFRRHRVAEYPVDVQSQVPVTEVAEAPIPERQQESKPGSNLPTSITLSEIQKDKLTKIALDNWSKAGDSDAPRKPFSPELVKEIYDTELTVKGNSSSSIFLSYSKYFWVLVEFARVDCKRCKKK